MITMFQGSGVALVTPMLDNGEIDFPTLSALVKWHIHSGTQAIIVGGSTGEASTLTENEQLKMLETVLEEVERKIPIIAGISGNSTHKVISICQNVMSLDIAGMMIVTPYYNKPTQEGLYQHFASINHAVSKPIILYNVPGRTAVDLLPETVGKLSQLENIVGIKDATGDIKRLLELNNACDKTFNYFSGDDSTALEFIIHGGQGVISVTSNIAPAKMQLMCESALNGQIEKARQLNAKLALVHQRLMIESNPIPVKWALQSMGKIAKGIRLPLTYLAEVHREPVRDALLEAGVFNE